MKKQIFIIFIMIFTLTGCQAVANIDIEKDTITETITAVANDNDEYNKIKNWNGFPLPKYQEDSSPYDNGDEKRSGVEYYNNYSDDSTKKVTATAKFPLEKYNGSSFALGCFNHFNVLEDEDNVFVFSTSKGLMCDFYPFKVIVKTPYKVISNNAQIVDSENNIYTWDFKDLKTQNNIYLEIDFTKNYDGTSVEQKDNNQVENQTNNTTKTNYKLYIVLITIGIFSLIVVLIVLKKKKEEVSKL